MSPNNPAGTTSPISQEAGRRADGIVELPASIAVRELAELLGLPTVEIIKSLIKRGVMANINQNIDFSSAASVAQERGFQVEMKGAAVGVASGKRRPQDGDLETRAPVVVVMGHVDHGKTTLLDAIRRTKVAAGEVGGITQHIGAYQVEIDGHPITFLDTPGHEAFTAMRARGARVTDVAVIVVAADDGIMPQTVEAIDHAKAAEVPIVVAINKVDVPGADVEMVKRGLTEHGLVVEEWGGDVIALPVSAKTGEGLNDLLENILVVAEVADLKAMRDRPAVGVVLEAEMDSTRGPVVNVIVEDGTLNAGDVVVAGVTWGKVRAMFNEFGHRVKKAGPSTPVKILGLASVPAAGDKFEVEANEKQARAIVEERRRELQTTSRRSLSLESISSEVAAGKVKDLNIILKGDVQGSIEAIRSAVEKLSNPHVNVRVIHAGTGLISESDVMLAAASNAIVIGFHTRADAGARQVAENEGVDIRYYEIIYQLTDNIEKAVAGLLEPEVVETVDGHAQVRQIFKVRSGRIAGCYVLDGTLSRSSAARVLRGGEVIHSSRLSSLRRFQEDVRDVQAGHECGIGVEGFERFEEGDVIESFHQQRKAR